MKLPTRLLLFPGAHSLESEESRYQALVTRVWETLTAEERIELSMLPNPANAHENGSDLARALFRCTQQAGSGGLDLDEMMAILAEPIQSYLLSHGYVRQTNRITSAGRRLRYTWSSIADAWNAAFE